MSQIFKVFFAALAASATFGAVQFASGHDLMGRRELAATEPAGEINRAAKADRAALRAAPGRTETITIRNVGLDDTSVVVRVPVVQAPVVQPPGGHRGGPEPSSGAGQARIEDDGGLRTSGQRVDRSRKTASARPLRDLIAA